MPELSPSECAKFAAAHRATALVEDGMALGLGTGSTAAWMVRCVAARVRAEGLRLTCVPTSELTALQARALGLTVVGLDDAGTLDLTIDGADEFDPEMRLIKGGGGAHLREKIVAAASRRMVVIADPGKRVSHLGAFDLPVEVLAFGLASTMDRIHSVLDEADVAACEIGVRMDGAERFRTDEGNLVVDCALGRIGAPDALSAALLAVPGVVETGLFLGLCGTVVIGHPDGTVETLPAPGAPPEMGRVDLALAAGLPG